MQQIDSYVPAEKAEWQKIFTNVLKTGETVAITDNGVPGAVILPYDTFAGILETLDILASETTVRQLIKSARDAEQGRFVDMEEAFK